MLMFQAYSQLSCLLLYFLTLDCLLQDVFTYIYIYIHTPQVPRPSVCENTEHVFKSWLYTIFSRTWRVHEMPHKVC